MKFIADFLIFISNKTVPIAFVILLMGVIAGLIRTISTFLQRRTQLISKKLEPEVAKIKEKYLEEEQLAKLSDLYKANHYSFIIPTILKIVSIFISISIFSVVINIPSFDLSNYHNSTAFFAIKNIFEKQLIVILPILITLINIICMFITSTKKDLKNNWKVNVISQIVLLFVNVVFSNIFAPIYAIYTLGSSTTSQVLNIIINKKLKEIAIQS